MNLLNLQFDTQTTAQEAKINTQEAAQKLNEQQLT